MWIFLNNHICDLKDGPALTFLRTMFKVEQAGRDLTREELAEPGQKVGTISKHLKKAVEVGLLKRMPNKYQINGEWKSAASTNIVCNPTHKVWFDKITNASAYMVQDWFGKKQTEYYIKKYEPIRTDDMKVEEITAEDKDTHLFREELNVLGHTYIIYTQ